MIKNVKNQVKGITLIALVVTIIVLLILAGVAINLSIGNNGLFTRAENAVNTWRRAEINEQDEIGNFEGLYDNTLKDLGLEGGNGGIKKPIGEITGEETLNTETEDKKGNRIVVPAGFKVVNPEETVNEGIVVEDVNGNNLDTVGNQFVWIPCTLDGANNTLKYDRHAFTRETPTWSYRQSLVLGTNGEYEKDNDGSYKIVREDNKSYYYHEAMSEQEKTSIEKYGGFYIGRYEVGTDNARGSNTGTTDVARVKANLPVYNWITRDESVTIAERMYEGKSRLCSSYAWDTALKYIDGETGTWSVNSQGGNYVGGLKNTGYHEMKNIYDMGGNIWEWTTETFTHASYPCVYRSGSYGLALGVYPAGIREDAVTISSHFSIGARITLYM